jgi:hypothetical protein
MGSDDMVLVAVDEDLELVLYILLHGCGDRPEDELVYEGVVADRDVEGMAEEGAPCGRVAAQDVRSTKSPNSCE